MRNLFLTALFAAAVGIGAAQAAEIIVKVAPPRAIVEHRTAAPGPGWIWIRGYHRWDGRAYVWAPGHWERPPHAHAVWVSPRWEHRHEGWAFVEGRWR